MKKLLLLSTLLLLPELSQAQIFKLTRVASSTGNATILAAFDAEILKIQNQINEDLPAASPQRLIDGMADSQSVATKGFATDYISHFDKILVGAGVGLGADLEKDKELDSDLSGIGVAGGIQVGLNTSMFVENTFLGLDPKKLSVMLNFFTFGTDQNFDDASAKIDMLSFGAMGSYKWIEGNGNRLFGWDGVRLHTGYQYSSTKYGFTTKINETVNENTSEGTITGTVTGNPSADIESTSHSIPLEISSGINFLYILSFYGGVGTDINFGSASGKGALNANDSTLTCTGGNCAGNPTVTVRANADLDNNGKVQPLFLRGFAGFQVNLPYTRIYVHANNVFGTDLYSVATGLRLAF